MQMKNIKQAAHQLIDQLPEGEVTWEKLAYEMEVRASIERGLADVDAGRLAPIEDVFKEFGID